jgi:hypothetical protein
MDDDLLDLTSDIDGNLQEDQGLDKIDTSAPPHVKDEESPLGSGVETGNHDDTGDIMESVIGNSPRGTIAEEVAQDEARRRGMDTDDVLESLAVAPDEAPDLPRSDEVEYTDTDATPPDDKQ